MWKKDSNNSILPLQQYATYNVHNIGINSLYKLTHAILITTLLSPPSIYNCSNWVTENSNNPNRVRDFVSYVKYQI